jgi:predicted Zn-dependent protease
LKTQGFVAANNYGALNLKQENGFLKIYFSPLQKIEDQLVIKDGDKTIYDKTLHLKTLQLFKDSIKIIAKHNDLVATLGKNKLKYEEAPTANNLSRPVESPADFDWKTSYGLYLQGKEDLRQRYYIPAEEKLRASLQKELYYIPALTALSMILCRNMQYDSALATVKKALSVDTYDEAANYYYGIINTKLGNTIDAKDGFDIATMGTEYRSAAYMALANIYLKEQNFDKAVEYAHKSIAYNRYAIDAYQLLAVIYRTRHNQTEAVKILDTINQYDALNHFSRFEKYLWKPTVENEKAFTGLVRNEMPQETFLELAIWYYDAGRNGDALKVLQLAPTNTEIQYWQAFLENKPLNIQRLRPEMVFPFRSETADVLKQLIKTNNHWLLKYHLALIQWNFNNTDAVKSLFDSIGNTANYAPFYAARANFNMKNNPGNVLNDLQHAKEMDKNQWRYGKNLITFYLSQNQYQQALQVAEEYKALSKGNYVMEMLYTKSLLANKMYTDANALLKTIEILPNEGATGGRKLYEETQLMLALQEMKNKHFDKALEYISSARLWPENLGVGKPYAQEIDERLEDWLAYEAYVKQGNEKTAKEMLDKILVSPKEKGSLVNRLVTAWALQKTGKRSEGEKLLTDLQEENPHDEYANWAKSAFNGENKSLPDNANMDMNYIVLNELLKMKL